jgi:mannose-6-phosphate isomerase-like protein (cupin superfamily)
MGNKITYRSSKQYLDINTLDPSTGSEFWSMEGQNVQFTWFDIPANTNFPNHKHDSEQITYVLEGELFFKTDDTVYRLAKGDCILVPRNIDHEVWTKNLLLRQLMRGHRLIRYMLPTRIH